MRRDDISKKEKMQVHQGLAPTFDAMVDVLQCRYCRKNADVKCQGDGGQFVTAQQKRSPKAPFC
jgi:hypothetical protein